MKVAHISDLHMLSQKTDIFRGANPYHNFLVTLRAIKNKDYDFILATGDISENGSQESYLLINDALQEINIPIHFIPGNHDDVNNMRSILDKHVFTNATSIDFGSSRLCVEC